MVIPLCCYECKLNNTNDVMGQLWVGDFDFGEWFEMLKSGIGNFRSKPQRYPPVAD
jgi:hypothetical protein